LSSIIKSSFISFSDQKKTIEVVSKNDKNIINPNFENKEKEESFEDNSDEEQESNDGEVDFINEDRIQEDENLQEEEPSHQMDIVEQAYLEAEEILNSAKNEAQEIQQKAYEEGYEQGYNEGALKFQEIEEQLKAELELKLDDMDRNQREFLERTQPQIAMIIQKLVEKMIGICRFDKDIILFLIKCGLEEVELYGDLIIRVSAEDFDEVIENKDILSENFSEKIVFEVLKDSKLKKNDCVIETSMGSVNCGLEERMNGLIRNLKLIEESYYSAKPETETD